MRLGDVFTDTEVARLYRYRAPYPDGVFAILQRLMTGPHVVLDVGAGTGALARRMLAFAERVDAVDPSAAMIAEGRRLAGGSDRRLRWMLGRLEEVELDPPYGLISAGASLHWLDPDVALPRLRSALAPGAMLAVVDAEIAHRDHRDDVDRVIREYSELDDHKETRQFVEDLLARGRFELLGREHVRGGTTEQSVDDYVEMLHSTSTLARVRLGARADAFDGDIRSVFARHGLDRTRAEVNAVVLWGRPQ